MGERTHCPRGHIYDEANTIRQKNGRWCRACSRAKDIAMYAKSSDEHKMWKTAQTRARNKGVPFTITPGDIVIPSHCPVLGVPLKRIGGPPPPAPSTPSLDRIEAAKGYVPGNVVVISFRANRIKTDATLKELKRVAAWLETVLRK